MQTVHCPCCEFVFAGQASGENRCQYCGTVIPGLPPGEDLIPVTDQPVPVTGTGAPVREQADEAASALDQGDPAAEIMLALSEPCGLSAAELARLAPDRPRGTCSSCHLPLPPGRPRKCSWCQALTDLRAAPPPAEKTLAGPRTAVSRPACLIPLAGAWAFLLLTIFVSHGYVIAVIILLAATGCRGLR